MSKKSGVFHSLLAMIGLMSMAVKQNSKTIYQPEPAKKFGKRHRTFGKEITSYGAKPNYGHLKRKPFYQAKVDERRKKHEAMVWELGQAGIIWTAVGNYREKVS